MATDLSQYVKLIQNPTSTPGVVNTTLWVDPNAPADVQAAVQRARETNSILGGIGGLSPQQQYDNVIQAYSSVANQPATLTGPTQAPVVGQNQYPVNTPIPTDWTDLVAEEPSSYAGQDNMPVAADGGGGVGQPGSALGNNGLTVPTALPGTNSGNFVGPTWGNLVPGASGGNLNLPTNTPTLGGVTTVPSGGGSGEVPTGGTTTNTPGTFTQAPMPTGVSGNYAQVQNGLQSGQFATTGQNVQAQAQQSGQATSGTTTNQSNQQTTENINQNRVGTSISNTSTSGKETEQSRATTNQVEQAIDTLGFGQLLKDQAGAIQASDAARSTWLQDVMNTGGTGFQSQMDQAIRNSLTGPQTTGAGDSARARMASYGAAEIGRTNLNQRLAAADQLAGTTGLANLSTAANPYIGRSTTGVTDTNTTRQNNTTGTTNTASNDQTFGNNTTNTTGNSTQNTTGTTTGWQNMLSAGSESQSGTTAATSSQAGAGNIPEGQPVKTGGCVLCTAGIQLGLWKPKRVLKTAIAYKLGPGWKKFRLAARGYFAVFGPFANFLLDHPKLAAVLAPLARMVVYEELRQAGRKLPLRKRAWLVHWIGDLFCRVVGLLPVCGYVKQQRILDIAKREGILFNVEA